MAQHSPKLIVSQLSTHPQKGPHTAKPDRDAGPPLPALLEPQLGDLGTFWTSFDRATDDYDKDMLDALKASMDNLLIFAALFSAVNSAVLPLSAPMLSANPGDQSNMYLCLLAQQVSNTTVTCEPSNPSLFTPTSQAIRINQLFSISLTCSLLAAFGALMGQQWVSSYRRRPDGGFEEERRERQRRLLGAKRWRLEPVLELILPILLQLSLVIFLVGLVQYLQSLNYPVALPNTILAWLGAGLFFLTILFSLSDPHCPFKTPLSTIIRALLNRVPVGVNTLQEILRRTTLRKWLYRAWDDELLAGHSIRRVLATSSDATVLYDTALNVPLVQNGESLEVIHSDDVALLHLFRLYETHSMQGSEDEGIYSAALCHLALSSGQDDPTWTARSLHFRELAVILSAARGIIASSSDRKPNVPSIQTDLRSALPSSIMTVGLAYLVSTLNKGDHLAKVVSQKPDFLKFLLTPGKLRATLDVHVAVIAWLLISSPECLPDDKRKKSHDALVFQNSPPRVESESASGLFCYASEAYHRFYRPELAKTWDRHRSIPVGILECVAQALEYHQQMHGETARSLLLGVLKGMSDVLDPDTPLEEITRLVIVLRSVLPHLRNADDEEIRLAAARLTHAICKYCYNHQYLKPLDELPMEARDWLAGYRNGAPNDEEFGSWLRKHWTPAP